MNLSLNHDGTFEFECSSCHAKSMLPEACAGTIMPCPSCGQSVAVEALPSAVPDEGLSHPNQTEISRAEDQVSDPTVEGRSAQSSMETRGASYAGGMAVIAIGVGCIIVSFMISLGNRQTAMDSIRRGDPLRAMNKMQSMQGSQAFAGLLFWGGAIAIAVGIGIALAQSQKAAPASGSASASSESRSDAAGLPTRSREDVLEEENRRLREELARLKTNP